MRNYLLTAPSWLLVIIYGVPFGAAMGILSTADGISATFALVGGLVVGAFFGAAMTYTTNAQRRSERRALGAVRQQDWNAARRAAARGAVPADPEVRAAAARLAMDQLNSLRRRRKLSVIVFGLNLVIAVVNLFVNASPWYAVLAICWTVGLAGQWYLPHRLRHRINLLTDDKHNV